MLRLLASLCLAFACVSAQAATYYVTQAGTGSANGSDLANAASVATLNSHTSAPDDVISLNGTITTAVTVHNSGTSGHPITYLFATGAKLSAAAWAQSGALISTGKSYLVIDGGTDGAIENTANGTGLANQVDSRGIEINGGSNITVQNLSIRNLYVRTANSSDSLAYAYAIESLDCSSLTITNCTINYAFFGIYAILTSAATDGLTISNCGISRCSTGIVNALGGAFNYTNVSIHDNTISEGFYWDGTWTPPPGDGHHHNDGIHIWGSYSSNRVGPIRLYNNTIGGNMGAHCTGLIFIEDYPTDVQIYNNILKTTGAKTTDGQIVWSGSITAGAALKILNNTFIGTSSAGTSDIGVQISGVTTGAALIQNNIFSALWIGLYNSGSRTLSVNFNDYYALSYLAWVGAGSTYSTLASWQAASGGEANGLALNPMLDASANITTASPCYNAGTSQSAYFTTDRVGTTRPQAVIWDIGSMEVLAVTLPIPNPSIIASTSPTATTVTVTATATTGGTGAISYNHAINGTYAGLQASPTRTFTGLTPSTSYAFKVKAQDSATIPNTTTESAVSNVSTTGTIPTVSTVTVPPAGTTIVVGLSASCTTGTGGSGGFTATVTTGAALTISGVAGSGSSTYTLTTNRTILGTDVFKLNYAQPGNGIEATTGGADLASFTLRTVTNGSTQVAPTAPSVASLSIPNGGTTLGVVWNQSASVGVGGSTGFTIVASAGAMTGTYSTGSPGTTFTLNLSRTAVSGETVLLSYTNPGNGIEGTAGGIDVANFSGLTVFNQSTQGIPTTTPTPPAPDRQPKPKKKR